MSAKTNLILDLSMFTAILVVSNPHLTGSTIHEWLAISLGAAILTHLLFHWDWVIKVGVQFFKKLFHRSRLNFIVNMLFFITMTGTLFSGLMISQRVLPSLGIHLDVSRSWKSIHTLMSDASIIMLGVHFAMHLKWVTANAGRYLLSSVRNLFARRSQISSLAVRPVRIDDEK